MKKRKKREDGQFEFNGFGERKRKGRFLHDARVPENQFFRAMEPLPSSTNLFSSVVLM